MKNISDQQAIHKHKKRNCNQNKFTDSSARQERLHTRLVKNESDAGI